MPTGELEISARRHDRFAVIVAAERGCELLRRTHVSTFDAAFRQLIRAGLVLGVLPRGAVGRCAGPYGLRIVVSTDAWARRLYDHPPSRRPADPAAP